ncbi:MAG TPA: DUF3034 family protein [Bryobacteraceae bacterium]|nr:DUF3034 family protein [Bryobacteraceae bacterium]
MSFIREFRIYLSLVPLVLCGASGPLRAQSLDWEGQTGVLLTPFAYTAPSDANKAGLPVVGFHFLDAGSVLGDFETISVTEGFVKHIELGYTRTIQEAGSNAALSPLWTAGFNIAHGKVNLVPENVKKHNWVPAIAAGFVARQGDQNVSGALLTPHRNYTNGDFYAVATKTITQTKKVPILLSFGVKGTNAAVLGLAGNAPDWRARMFGAGAFVFTGPHKTSIILAAEFVQEQKAILNLPSADIPTTIAYALRFVPRSETKFNVDLAVAQVANRIIPGVNLNARAQFGMGVSYGF